MLQDKDDLFNKLERIYLDMIYNEGVQTQCQNEVWHMLEQRLQLLEDSRANIDKINNFCKETEVQIKENCHKAYEEVCNIADTTWDGLNDDAAVGILTFSEKKKLYFEKTLSRIAFSKRENRP